METPTPAAPRLVSIEERKAILTRAITHYMSQGYRVVSQTDTTAQMIKPKAFSCLLAALSFFCIPFLGVFLYLFMFLAAKDWQVYIVVDEFGVATYNGKMAGSAAKTASGPTLLDSLGNSVAADRLRDAWAQGPAERAMLVVGGGVMFITAFFACLVLPLMLLSAP